MALPSESLAALCAVTSFLWLANSLEGHQLIEQPRLSSLLVLLTAGVASYAASFFAFWLPGANGRYDDDLGGLRTSRASLPNKPRKYYLPGLVICIILRLELFHRVTVDLACSTPGIEACLPLVILFYELLPGRRARSDSDVQEKDDDPGRTIYDVLGDALSNWLNESKMSLIVGTIALTYGACLSSKQSIKSAFFCASIDSSYLVFALQTTGLLLDGVIAILLWRTLAWARTTKSRLKTLSTILLASSLGTGFLYWSFRLFQRLRPMSYHFRGLDSLYIFDIAVDGLAFSIFFISAGLLTTEGSPLSLVGIVTFLSGLLSALQKTLLIGSWENVSPSITLWSLVLICTGFSFFVYANNLRSILFLRRAFVIFLLVVIVISATIFSIARGRGVLNDHPLQRLIYDARVESGRWLVHATVSDSLPIAVQEYKERHNKRDPPSNFDVWYRFAKERNSPTMDHFAQMETDILPFWGIAPDKIREGIHQVGAEPGIAMIRIHKGKATHNVPHGSPQKVVVDDLVNMIGVFAEHLADMELPVNLNDQPRVIAPWDDVQRFTTAGKRKGLGKLLSRRSDLSEDKPSFEGPSEMTDTSSTPLPKSFTSVRALREMTALTCPPGTTMRSGVHWDIRDFCPSCAKPQSQGQYLTNWPLSQSLCHQSDMLRLHGFHMSSPKLRPIQELLPVFSRSKTDSYSDILIPLRRVEEPVKDDGRDFAMKRTRLFWRGSVRRAESSHELLRGGHQERLVHLVNHASSTDKTTILLPVAKNRDKFAHLRASTAELNGLLPMDIAFSDYNACGEGDKACQGLAQSEFITGEDPKSVTPQANKYILTMDTDLGPPRDFLEVLRSSSVPFHASIFKEWYSERLMPWIHFVPIDLRFHGLHSTLAYFAGIKKGLDGEGEDMEMEAKTEEGKWIAEQGKRWAEKAIRREDMEVYLFRLLLEWGRVVDDRREEVGFVLT
ncbi:glycosyltransferase family 90 protein [Cercophora scortea]|uniref:Glycosyltransferase family 90 protein n=1 Tax=Cercophora scortea TaxID=314031 RepID=A0AAE0J542_9PEZI|nr:glycosyltransferase family 90 protein [Cercophora scortea]